MPTTPTTLIESLSRDPVERALAAQALQVLHNRALPPATQHARIALLQQALLAHRARPQPAPEGQRPAAPARRSAASHGADPQALRARQRELGRDDPPVLPTPAPTPAAPTPASAPVGAAALDRAPTLRASTLTLRRRR